MEWREMMTLLAKKEPCAKLRFSRPPSVNNGYEHKGEFLINKTQHHKDWIKQARLEMWGQQWEFFDTPVAIVYEFNKKYAIEDCANFEKAASDFLVRHHILKDDSLIWFNAQTWGNSKETVANIFRL